MAANNDSLQSLLGDFKTTNDILTTSYEREIALILKSLKNGAKFKQISNSLYAILNKYELQLGSFYFKKSLIELGDSLKFLNEYTLAITHGYDRYMQSVGVMWSSLDSLFSKSHNKDETELNLRSVIGYCLCSYKLILKDDSRLIIPSNRSSCLTLLHYLQQCVRCSLSIESHYWLLYNSITLCYSIARLLMSVNLFEQVLRTLIWCAVSIESCVPLMAPRYLSLRGVLYIAVTQCYYNTQHPQEGEWFARRSLEKVHQLSQIQAQVDPTNQYKNSFTEVAVKLCVMVFKRAVFETHRKTKYVLRPKVRPTIKDLLQTQWPRSPTEKLLDELFKGSAAQFLAIMEFLSDPTKRPLQRATPRPLTDLDTETIADVYQEIFTAGVELANEGLMYITGEETDPNISMMEYATKGSDMIPLESIVRFTHLCFSSDCLEAFNMLTPLLTRVCADNDSSVGNRLTVITTCEELKECIRKGSVLEDKDIWVKCQMLLYLLYSSMEDGSLEADLVMDVAVLIWEGCGSLYGSVLSHDCYYNCRSLIASNGKFISFLQKLLAVFGYINMANHDPVLYSKVLMKYVLLLEMESYLGEDSQVTSKPTLTPPHEFPIFNPFIKYDRTKLLNCQAALQSGLSDISKARDLLFDILIPSTVEMLEVIHAELICAEIRIAVKLASTIPTKCPFEESPKPSTLPHKKEQREFEKQLWNKMLSSITSPEANVLSEQELLKGCGSNKFKSSILLMTIVAFLRPPLVNNDTAEKESKQKLLKEAYNMLVQSEVSIATVTSSSFSSSDGDVPPTNVPPPPVLVYRSPTTMVFRPAPFTSTTQPVLYYSLYGHEASGNNVRVRLRDYNYTGLGIEVPVNQMTNSCTITVSGLKPHTEYVFALAAHGPGGKVIGESPGIPTDPILASYSLSHCVGCGLLCQYAYKTGNYSIAGKSAGMIWKRFVASLTTDDIGAIPQYKLRPEILSTTPTPLLRLFAVSILIGAHSRILSKRLHPNTSLPLTTPPYTSQQERLNLVGKLRVGLRVCGWLNDHALSLQMVVMCYTLLVPFIQTSLTIRSITEVLVQCLTVLHSLPDNVVISKQITVIAGLHHMTAVIGHTLIKAFSSPGLKATALPIVSDMCRSRLIFTLPAAHFTNQETPSKGGLQNSSLTSTLSSSVTGSLSYSVYGSSVVLPTATLTTNNDKVGNRYKKRKRKALSIGDTIPEEMKTVQYKTIDGFYMYTNSGSTGSDDVDLTGQEDPALLHNAINLLSVQAAYKEVAKFKRRPQYLEYIVHLANKAFTQGKGELIVDWCQEVFTWIKKRNEIILSAKSPQAAKPDPNKEQSQKTHTQNSLASSFNHHACSKTVGGATAPTTKAVDNTRNTSGSAATKRVKGSGESGRSDSKGGASTSPTKKGSTATSPANKAAITSKLMNEYKNLLSVRQDGKKAMITKPRVTRDDLKAKAVSVLQTILPRVWRVSRCRKRFRTVSNEEKPWRAQINIFLAYCNLQSIIDKIYCATPTNLNQYAFDWFRLDVCGQLLEWAVPPHPPSMPKESSHAQDPNQSNTTPTNETPPQYDAALLEKDLSQLMTHLQRALVLAHRGGCLVLVVNICRLIWNTVSIIRHYIYTNDSSQGLTAGLLYGTALGCLYIAGDILIDVYKHIEKCISGEQVSLSCANLLFEKTFLHQFLLLVVNVCHSNHHWEKILTLEQQMDANTKLSLRDYLKPIVTESRSNLQLRIEAHSSAITKQAVDPAAHLDVRAYNLYGTVGYSLGMSAIPLDSAHEDSLKEEHVTPPSKGEEILKQARYLYSQYLSTRIRQGTSDASLSEIEHIMDCYKEALKELKMEEDGENGRSLKLQAFHELGNILFYMNDTRSAALWWVKGLKFLFHCKDPLSQWRSLDLFKKGCPLQLLGVWGCIIGGIIASKMGRLIHNNELDVRLEYHHLAAALFESLFRFSMPHPLKDIDYARYPLPTPLSLQFGVELFTDQFRCSLSLLITSLHDTAKEMVSRGHTHKTLPIISLFEHFSSQLARSVPYTVLARVCKAEALIQLSLYGDAIQCIKGLMTGADLPVLSNSYHTTSEGSSVGTGFSDHLPLNNSKNIKALSSLTDKTLSSSLRELYGPESVSAVLLVKSRLLVKLAATCPGIISRDLSTCHNRGYRSSSLTSVLSQGSLSKSMSTSVSWNKAKDNQDITSEDVKMALLEHSEKILSELLQETSVDIDVRVNGYLILSQISSSLSNYSSAVTLSLAAMRMLQNIDSSISFDPLLWLQTRITLADNTAVLMPPLHPKLATPTICREGIKEAQAMGEYELSAQFMYISAVYGFVSVQPLDVGGVRSDITECLHTLENCVELSLNGELLRCRASLLLAEVSLENDGEETNYDSMGKIYQGISRILGEQVLSMLIDDSAHNLYTPQLHLKLISDLHLAYCMSKTDSTQQYKAMLKDGLSLMESIHYTTVVNEVMVVEYQSMLALLAAVQASTTSSSSNESFIATLHLNAKALVEAISGCTSSGLDYIRTYQLYITLCETLVALGNITTPTITSTPPTSRSVSKVSSMESSQDSVSRKLSVPFTGGSPSSTPRRKGIMSQLSVDGGGVSPSGHKSSGGGSDLMSPRRKGIPSQLSVDVGGSKQRTRKMSLGGIGAASLADNKMVPKEYYQSWCALKLANTVMERYETLAQLSSELHNAEMNSPIPPSLIIKLPDGVISDLCPVYGATTEKLLTGYEPLPLDMLLPLASPDITSDLTWFSLLGYYYSLQRRCFRASPLWEGPRTHCLSSVLIPRVKAVLQFLSVHCPLFCSNCVLVKLPPPLSTLLPKSVVSGETTPIATPTEILPHLVSDEGEVSISWYQRGDTGPLKGLLSINHKALRSIVSMLPSVSFMKYSGAEVFTITSDPTQLANLRSMWEELDKKCGQYITEQTARPLSRSPSRMKKKTIEMAKKGVPSELQESIHKCVEKLIQTLSVKCIPLPAMVAPQSVASINRVIRALKPVPEKGDAYLFFKQVFFKELL